MRLGVCNSLCVCVPFHTDEKKEVWLLVDMCISWGNMFECVCCHFTQVNEHGDLRYCRPTWTHHLLAGCSQVCSWMWMNTGSWNASFKLWFFLQGEINMKGNKREDERHIWSRSRSTQATRNMKPTLWCQIHSLLPCPADPRCIHKGVGRWGPAAEFASLWTGRRGLCAFPR